MPICSIFSSDYIVLCLFTVIAQICIMAGRILTGLDLAQIEALSTIFAKKGKAKMAFQLARLDLRSKAAVFDRIQSQNKVKKHLADSVTTRLRKSFGEVIGVRFNYNWYGLFHNTGAKDSFGKGVNLPALQWQAAALNPEIDLFFAQIADFYGNVVVKNIEIKTLK